MTLVAERSPRLFMPLLAILLTSLLSPHSSAHTSDEGPELERQIVRSFDRGDYSHAVSVIEAYLEQTPNDASMLYNLACAYSRLNQIESAASALHRAFKAGFDRIDHMTRDPDLESLRGHPIYAAVLESSSLAGSRRAENAMNRWRETYGEEHYRFETDHVRRLNYATALDAISHKEMRDMLEQQADHVIGWLFDDMPSYHVLIAIPTPSDADKFFKDRSIGGLYQHNMRRVVARDIGGSLRHEFFHALHFGHMEKLGQAHALWVQEGLASLFEDYEIDGDGTIRFLPNDRQLIMKSRARAGRLTPWSEIFAMSADGFMDRATQMYPTARSIFEFVADRGKLQAWYHAYIANFRDDRTGAKAFEAAFAMPVKDIERQWRQWVVDQPAVNVRVRPESAAMGIRTAEFGSNDGVLITEIVAGSGAAKANLRKGDVIVALNEKSTRTLIDLRKVVASGQAGDEIQVRARRNGEYFTVTVVLRPIRGA